MIRTVSAACLALALLAAGGPTLAAAPASSPSLQVERDEVARGWNTQLQLSLIRERKLADDRETRQLADFQARLLKAHDAVVAAKSDVHAARQALDARTAELEAARADLARLADTIAAKDADARAQIDALRREAQNLAAQASQEKLAALQQFADGDRVGAEPLLEELDAAQDRAIESAANIRRAELKREDAGRLDIMRAHGERTLAAVIQRWETVVALDASQTHDWLTLSYLYKTAGRLPDARKAAEQAVTTAPGPRERARALSALGDVKYAQGDTVGALAVYGEGLDARRKLAAALPGDALMQQGLAISLEPTLAAMDHAGLLAPVDRPWLDEAIAHAGHGSQP